MKKIVNLLTAVIVCFSAATVPTQVTRADQNPTEAYVGDVDVNGAVDAADASAILGAYGRLSVGEEANVRKELADINHDNAIDASDASQVLQMYTIASTGGNVQYEVVILGSVDQGAQELKENDLVEYNNVSIYIYTSAECNSLYLNKPILQNGDKFRILQNLGNNLYKVTFSLNNEEELYIRIPESASDRFQKIGEINVFYYDPDEPDESSTTTTATTTTAAVIETTTTTVATSTTPETTTDIQVTTTSEDVTTNPAASTITNPKIIIDDNNEPTPGSVYEFTGWSWYLHKDMTDDQVGEQVLENGDRFVIIEEMGNWYKVLLSNDVERYLYVSQTDMTLYFTKLGRIEITSNTQNEQPSDIQASMMFVGEQWNVRSSTSLVEDNIIDTLSYGDVIDIIEYKPDSGWVRIVSDKGTTAYVLLDTYNFIAVK